MGNIVTTEANALLTASVSGGTYTGPSGAIKLALITSTTPSTASAAGSEVSGGSYARQTITFGSASAGSISNNAAVNFTGMPGPITLGGIELWDSAGTPVRRWFGTLNGGNKSVNAGDTVTFNSAALVVSLS